MGRYGRRAAEVADYVERDPCLGRRVVAGEPVAFASPLTTIARLARNGCAPQSNSPPMQPKSIKAALSFIPAVMCTLIIRLKDLCRRERDR